MARLLPEEQMRLEVSPQLAANPSLNPPTDPGQAALLNTIQNPPPANPLLQAIGNPNPATFEGPSFGRQVANMLLGEIPVLGGILQQRHANAFLEEQRANQLQALAQGASELSPGSQKLLGSMVQQGRFDAALKEFPDLYQKELKIKNENQADAGLREAIGARIDRLSDPIMKASLKALAVKDPKSALIQLGQHENALISQGFRGRAEGRAVTTQQQSVLEQSIKDVKDNDAGKRALAIKEALVSKQFTPEDLNLSSAKFAAKFGFKKEEGSNIKLQVADWINSKKSGGIFGTSVGASLPGELASNPAKLFEGIEARFATPEALAEQQKTIEVRNQLQQQLNEIRSMAAPQPGEAQAPKGKEVKRKYQGRTAVFDAKTKKFLRFE